MRRAGWLAKVSDGRLTFVVASIGAGFRDTTGSPVARIPPERGTTVRRADYTPAECETNCRSFRCTCWPLIIPNSPPNRSGC